MPISDGPDIDLAPVLHVERIGSTNEDLLIRARAGEHGPLWLRSDVQVQGRGRQGRGWISPVGNLYSSLLLHAPAERRVLPQLSHVAGVALALAIRSVVGVEPGPRLKWPNDLLFGSAKVAGILVEGTQGPDGLPSCVVGWGVNCAAHPADLPYEATNLTAQAGRPVAPGDVFDALRSAMAEVVRLWDRGRGYSAVRELWLQAAHPLGTPISVKGPEPLHGLFEGIDAEGRLLIGLPDGTRTIAAGDIVLRDQPAPVPG